MDRVRRIIKIIIYMNSSKSMCNHYIYIFIYIYYISMRPSAEQCSLWAALQHRVPPQSECHPRRGESSQLVPPSNGWGGKHGRRTGVRTSAHPDEIMHWSAVSCHSYAKLIRRIWTFPCSELNKKKKRKSWIVSTGSIVWFNCSPLIPIILFSVSRS